MVPQATEEERRTKKNNKDKERGPVGRTSCGARRRRMKSECSRSSMSPLERFHASLFTPPGNAPWDRMGSVCWRSHDHTVSDKDRAIMRKVNEGREQIRADRKNENGRGSACMG